MYYGTYRGKSYNVDFQEQIYYMRIVTFFTFFLIMICSSTRATLSQSSTCERCWRFGKYISSYQILHNKKSLQRLPSASRFCVMMYRLESQTNKSDENLLCNLLNTKWTSKLPPDRMPLFKDGNLLRLHEEIHCDFPHVWIYRANCCNNNIFPLHFVETNFYGLFQADWYARIDF